MALSITVRGTERLRRRIMRLRNGIRNMHNDDFAQQMKLKAREFLNETAKGWPNPNSTPIQFYARTRKLADGKQIILYAVGRGSDGTLFAAVQEEGYTLPRYSKSMRTLLRTGKVSSDMQPMRFRTPEGRWVSVYETGPIPAKKFMEKTALWAANAYPKFIEQKVRAAAR